MVNITLSTLVKLKSKTSVNKAIQNGNLSVKQVLRRKYNIEINIPSYKINISNNSNNNIDPYFITGLCSSSVAGSVASQQGGGGGEVSFGLGLISLMLWN